MASIIILTIAAIIILYLGLYKQKGALLPVSLLGLLAAGGSLVMEWDTNESYFNNMMLVDNYSIAFSILLIVITSLIFMISSNYFEKIHSGAAECYAILLFALAGGVVMTSFENMSMLFIGIEILSVSMYVMTGIDRENEASNEAALKYFLMGAFFTGFLLFGIALVYGATGSFDITTIANNANEEPVLFYVGVFFILIAMMFKVGVAPFHFWTPDVYHGSPSLITTYMATVVKIAAFAAFYRLFGMAFSQVFAQWTETLAIIIVLTLILSNLSASYQHSVKRMLAYSSVSHAGYMLIAVFVLCAASPNALLVYSIAYSVATVIVFGVLIAIKEQRGGELIADFNGLARTNPMLALVMAIALSSLAGIPLTAGFFGKFFYVWSCYIC